VPFSSQVFKQACLLCEAVWLNVKKKYPTIVRGILLLIMKFFSDKNGKFIYGVKSVLAILHLACLIYAKHIPLAFTLLGDQYLKEMSGLLKAC